MKRFLVIISFMLAVSFSGAVAQYSKAISADPLDLLISKVINITYEHKLSETNSFTVFASYYSFSDYWKAYGIGGSYRWYLTELLNDDTTPLSGLSAGPMARISFWDYSGPTFGGLIDYGGDVLIVVGGEVAYKFNFGNWFVEPIIRVGFGINDIDGLGYDPYGGGVNVGYSW